MLQNIALEISSTHKNFFFFCLFPYSPFLFKKKCRKGKMQTNAKHKEHEKHTNTKEKQNTMHAKTNKTTKIQESKRCMI
jgi:hypothetical protein